MGNYYQCNLGDFGFFLITGLAVAGLIAEYDKESNESTIDEASSYSYYQFQNVGKTSNKGN